MDTPNKKILVMEDEKPIARALELKLEHAGFETRIAENGEDGLALLLQEPFALVVLDLIMPKLDGFGVLEMMKEKNIQIPVIVLTDLTQQEDEKRVRELGAIGFFVKSNTLITQIVDLIKERLLT